MDPVATRTVGKEMPLPFVIDQPIGIVQPAFFATVCVFTFDGRIEFRNGPLSGREMKLWPQTLCVQRCLCFLCLSFALGLYLDLELERYLDLRIFAITRWFSVHGTRVSGEQNKSQKRADHSHRKPPSLVTRQPFAQSQVTA